MLKAVAQRVPRVRAGVVGSDKTLLRLNVAGSFGEPSSPARYDGSGLKAARGNLCCEPLLKLLDWLVAFVLAPAEGCYVPSAGKSHLLPRSCLLGYRK